MGISHMKVKLSLDGVVSVVGVVIILGSYLGLITPQHQGFYCDDPALSFVNNGDSLTLGGLFSIIYLLPIVFIILVELKRHRPFASESKLKNNPGTAFNISSKYRRSVFWRCCVLVYRTYLNGLLCACLIVEFLKITIGGLRPHFFDSCRPDFTKINCSQGFITEYECTKELPIWHHSDIFKSFPSGHAALSMYMSLFLCFYLHKQLILWPTGYITSLVQAMLVAWAIQCGCSRMTDHRHHWWDVLTGATIGAISCCHSAFWLCKIPPLCNTISPLPKDNWPEYERPKLILKSDSGRFASVNVNREEPYLFTSGELIEDKLTPEESTKSMVNHFEPMNSSAP